MSKETTPNQAKPLIFIDEASADPNRLGFRDLLSHPSYRVYITSPNAEKTRSRFYNLVDPLQILPVMAIQSPEQLRRGIIYQPALDTLFRPMTKPEGRIKKTISRLLSQTNMILQNDLLVFGQQIARPIDMRNVVFMLEDPQRPTHYDFVAKIADVLRTKPATKEVRPFFEGWQQYGIGDNFIKEIRDFIHNFEQCAQTPGGEFVRIPTLEIRNPHLHLVKSSADLPICATEPTPA